MRSSAIVAAFLGAALLAGTGACKKESKTNLLPASPTAGKKIVINEVLYDPTSTTPRFANEDLNGSGTVDSGDEFIEILNISSASINLDGWVVKWGGNKQSFSFTTGDSVGARLAILILPAWSSTNTNPAPTQLNGATVFRFTKTALELPNDVNSLGAVVILEDTAQGVSEDTFTYKGRKSVVDESWTRSPDGTVQTATTDPWVSHSTATGAAFGATPPAKGSSPGQKTSGANFP